MPADPTLTPESNTGMVGCYRPLDQSESASGELVEEFASTEYAGSAWGPDMQHGGPVAALLARAMDRCQPAAGTRISRIVVEILGAVPLTNVRTSARVVRPGRRIALLESDLWALTRDGRWQLAAQARAWRLAVSSTAGVVNRADAWAAPRHPPAINDLSVVALPEEWRTGFVNALEWRIERPFGGPGTSLAWLRLAQPLVAGEQATSLEQCVAIADTANGVGARLDAHTYTYLNTDLTIHLFDAPTGSWIGLAAETSVGPDGLGLSSAVMLDAAVGPIGRVAQTLLVQRRAGA